MTLNFYVAIQKGPFPDLINSLFYIIRQQKQQFFPIYTLVPFSKGTNLTLVPFVLTLVPFAQCTMLRWYPFALRS